MRRTNTNLETSVAARLEESLESEVLRLELADLRARYEKDVYKQKLEINELQSEKHIMEMQLSTMGSKALDERTREGSANLVQLQSQLCKAQHQVEVWSSQVGFVKKSYKKIIKTMQAELIEMKEAKCHAEQNAEREAILSERRLRRAKNTYEKRLVAQTQTINDLERQLGYEEFKQTAAKLLCQDRVVKDEATKACSRQEEMNTLLEAAKKLAIDGVKSDKITLPACSRKTEVSKGMRGSPGNSMHDGTQGKLPNQMVSVGSIYHNTESRSSALQHTFSDESALSIIKIPSSIAGKVDNMNGMVPIPGPLPERKEGKQIEAKMA